MFGRESSAVMRFKAGKLNVEGDMLVPDRRKGQVVVEKQSDGMLHFTWSVRNSGQPEENLIIFPEEVEFLALSECTTGKCFALKFKTSSMRLYFWLQEPEIEKFNEEFVQKMNRILMATQTSSKKKQKGSVDQELIRKATEAVNKFNQKRREGSSSNFQKIMTPEKIAPLLENDRIREKLFSFMPANLPKTKEEFDTAIRSPQFAQTLSFMDEALVSGDLAPLLLELGVDPSVGQVGGVDALIDAMKQKHSSEKKN